MPARNSRGQFIPSKSAPLTSPTTDQPDMSDPNASPSPSPPNNNTSGATSSTPVNTNPPPPPPPSGNLNTADIASIVSAVFLATQQAQAQQPAAVQPQQVATLPHFTGPPSINPSAGKLTVQDLFPEVEGTTLAAVVNHSLSANDIYKLDARYRDKPDRSTLELDGTSLRIKGDATARDYPSFSYIHQPMIVYFTILIHHVPDCKFFAAAAMLYIGQLQRLNDEYEWPAVLRYHLAFFHRRRREMQRGDYTRWGLRDGDLFDEYLVGHRRQRSTEQKKPNNKTGAPAEVCRNFNTGNCTSPCRGGRIHRCQTCGSEAHGASTHPAPATKTT